MSVLNVPLQINRGNYTTSTSSSLLEGEPFLDSITGTLYVKSIRNSDVSITGKSGSTNRLYNINNSWMFNFDATNPSSCTIGGYKVDYIIEGTKTRFQFYPQTDIIINSTQLRRLETTTLSNSMYGTSLPSSGEDGQLFFLIS